MRLIANTDALSNHRKIFDLKLPSLAGVRRMVPVQFAQCVIIICNRSTRQLINTYEINDPLHCTLLPFS